MREEYIKKTDEIDGVKYFDLGDEYVFNLEDKNGVSKEFHLTKPLTDEKFLANYIADKKAEMSAGE